MSLFLHGLRAEQLVFWRSRETAVFIFIFPLLLFLLLGSVYDDEIDGNPAAAVLLAGMLGYGVANTAFGGLAITLVLRREYAILKRIRSTPLPPAVYFASTLVSTLIVFAVQSVLLVVLGRLLFDAQVPSRLASLALALLLGAAAFAALGVALASLIRSAEGSSAVVNVIVLPMAFLSGSFGPTDGYPRVLQGIAEALPLRHFVELVNGIVLDGEHFWERPAQAAIVLAWGAVGAVVAVRRFGWEPRER